MRASLRSRLRRNVSRGIPGFAAVAAPTINLPSHMRATTPLVAVLAATAFACTNSSKLQDTASHGTAGANTDTATKMAPGSGATTAGAGAGSATKVKTIAGFQTTESVKWDASSVYWFVSNINGQAPANDVNVFISRLTKDGSVV